MVKRSKTPYTLVPFRPVSAMVPELISLWNRCHACGAQPIEGQRFECQTCPSGPDRDLCESCYQSFERGALKHPASDHPASHLDAVSHIFRAFPGSTRDQYLPWLAIPQSNEPTPRIPDRFAVRPVFESGPDSFFGGYAFVIAPENPGPPLVLTALHVMDELAKSKRIDCSKDSYTGQELPRILSRVNLYDVLAVNWMLVGLGTASSMLTLPNARTGDEEPYSQRDIAAFRADPSASLSPAKLAVLPPNVGDPIWLVVNLGSRSTARTLKAVVVEQTERTLVFRYAARTAPPRYSSGAPLVNRAGEVVGINVGGGALDGDHLGHANHATSIRGHLGLTLG